MTLLEAAIAMTIVGLVAVAALGEFASEIRAAGRAAGARVLQALVRDRLASLKIAPDDALTHLPDSLAQGVFPPPFSDYRWTAALTPDRGFAGLYHAEIVVRSPQGELALAARIYKTPPRHRAALP